MTTKEKMKEIIEEQPEDATYEEIIRELAFAAMVDRGLKDARQKRFISNEEMCEIGDAPHIYSLQDLMCVIYEKHATKIQNRCSWSAPSHYRPRN